MGSRHHCYYYTLLLTTWCMYVFKCTWSDSKINTSFGADPCMDTDCSQGKGGQSRRFVIKWFRLSWCHVSNIIIIIIIIVNLEVNETKYHNSNLSRNSTDFSNTFRQIVNKIYSEVTSKDNNYQKQSKQACLSKAKSCFWPGPRWALAKPVPQHWRRKVRVLCLSRDLK